MNRRDFAASWRSYEKGLSALPDASKPGVQLFPVESARECLKLRIGELKMDAVDEYYGTTYLNEHVRSRLTMSLVDQEKVVKTKNPRKL